MKLRNKKTGEIRELPDGFFCGDNLKKICEEWEDVPEEPKGIQCIYYVNHFDAAKIDGVIVGFETKDEAKKAVEKLKAWKKLKDYNVKFNLDFVRNKIDFTYSGNNSLLSVLDSQEQIFNSMNIIFGGEE